MAMGEERDVGYLLYCMYPFLITFTLFFSLIGTDETIDSYGRRRQPASQPTDDMETTVA
jgi:hypothetical protein